jgi:hypothetical protein
MTNTLVSKIAKAALDVGGKLSADRKNKDQGYDYLSADKILSICGQALFTQGIVVIPAVVHNEVILCEYVDQYNKQKRRYDAEVDFIFAISDGETSLEQTWSGAGSDYSVPDKALYKAITSGHKYFLAKLLCIGAGNEDGEHENESGETKPEPKTEKPTPPPVKSIREIVQPEPVKSNGSSPMTIDDALKMTTKDGELYGDLPTDRLSFMANSIAKVKNQTAEHEKKLLAIQTILKARAEKEG